MSHPSEPVWYCPRHGNVEPHVQVGSMLCPLCLDGDGRGGVPDYQTLSLVKVGPKTEVQDYDPTWDETDDAMRAETRDIRGGYGRHGAFRRRS